jgi:hypothetical protein
MTGRPALVQRLEQYAGISVSPTLLRYEIFLKSITPSLASAYRASVCCRSLMSLSKS